MSSGEPGIVSAKSSSASFIRQMPVWLCVMLLILATLFAYFNSVVGTFIFDDFTSIINEVPRLRNWSFGSNRPLLALSLALNYQWGKLNPLGYHVFNFAVHLTAGLTLFGIVRRTLSMASRPKAPQPCGCAETTSPTVYASSGRGLSKEAPRPADGMRGQENGVAFAVALLWLVHPLQTGSVTYIIQRCESMMGLFFLLCLYCVIRGACSRRGQIWYLGALVACVCGMGSKEVMVTAPLVILLYDRIFLTLSWRELFKRRGWLYVLMWLMTLPLVLPVLLRAASGEAAASAGFDYQGITPLEYLRTQPEVILHYLRLSFWPNPLCLDYSWPVVTNWSAAVLPGLAIVGLLLLTAVGLWKRPRLGFLGAAFFLILAPTSSFMPIADPAFEHRMYLPLAAVLTLTVLLIHRLCPRILRDARTCRLCQIALLMLVSAGLILRTVDRNRDYRVPLQMWKQVTVLAPHNGRAWNNVGVNLMQKKEMQAAAGNFRKALELNAEYVDALVNLAYCVAELGDRASAISYCQKALALEPDAEKAYRYLGRFYAADGDFERAVAAYQEAIRLKPDAPTGYLDLADLYVRMGRMRDAVPNYQRVLRLDPECAPAWHNLGLALFEESRYQEAEQAFRKALALVPSFKRATLQLSRLLATASDDSVRNGQESLALAKPLADAAETRSGEVLDVLAAAFAETGQFALAIETAEEAIRLETAAKKTGKAAEIKERLQLYREKKPYRIVPGAASVNPRVLRTVRMNGKWGEEE